MPVRVQSQRNMDGPYRRKGIDMQEEYAESIVVTERINGWWVTVRDTSGHEQHHGPYVDQETARNEADLLSNDLRPAPEGDTEDRA